MRIATWLGFLLALASPAAFAQAGPPLANITPRFVDFGSVRFGYFVPVPVTIRNLTAQPLALSGGGIPANGSFVLSTSTCGTLLAGNASCTLNYFFRPNVETDAPITQGVTFAVGNASGTQVSTVSFTGRTFGRMLDSTPQFIDFGEQLIGETVEVPVTLTNPLNEPVAFGGGGLPIGSPFTGDAGTCAGSIPANGTCIVNYRFTAGAVGVAEQLTSRLAFLNSGGGVQQVIPMSLRGTGIATPRFASVTPPDFGFGPQKLGTLRAVSLYYSNNGAVNMNVAGGGFSEAGTDGGAFSVVGVGGPGCAGGVVTPGTTCESNYFFQPKEARTHAGFTVLQFSRPPSDFIITDITMSGEGVGNLGTVWPQAIDFGPVKIGTNATLAVTVTNDSSLPIANFVGGNVLTPFQLLGTTCTTSIPVGASCVFTYRFNSSEFVPGAHETQTVISFNNTIGMQPAYTITLRGETLDRLFAHGFETPPP